MGNQYAGPPMRRRGCRQWYYSRRGGRGIGQGGTRRLPKEEFVGNDKEGKESSEGVEGDGPPRRYRTRRGGGGGRGGYMGSFGGNYGGGYYRSYRGPPRSDEEQGEGEGGSRGRKPPNRFLRRNFRKGRGGGRRPFINQSLYKIEQQERATIQVADVEKSDNNTGLEEEEDIVLILRKGKNIHILFIDMEKVLEKIRSGVWECLRERKNNRNTQDTIRQ
ncbi:hypothetical protein FQA39_LY11482 [Lamprigera yunnana]|nr:hypothetical protein FQA39_LY11482 [Lamprigera yunnana]